MGISVNLGEIATGIIPSWMVWILILAMEAAALRSLGFSN
jgi:hypothetical protein